MGSKRNLHRTLIFILLSIAILYGSFFFDKRSAKSPKEVVQVLHEKNLNASVRDPVVPVQKIALSKKPSGGIKPHIPNVQLPESYYANNTVDTIDTTNIETVFKGIKLVVSAHARGGSTFIGNIFKKYGNAMYWVEPDIYRDLYMKPDLIMPNEVTHFRDGKRRKMPSWEEDMHVAATRFMLECHISKIPPNILTFNAGVATHCDKFNEFAKKLPLHSAWQIYLTCAYKMPHAMRACDWKTHWLDPNHTCVNPRYPALYQQWRKSFNNPNFDHEKFLNVARDVNSCLEGLHKVIQRATGLLQPKCLSSVLNVVKYVRIRLHVLLKIVDADPSIRAIALYRDPRSIAASRQKAWGLRPFREDLVRHTVGLCEDVLDDHLLWEKVQQRYKDRILYVRYEDITADPILWTKRLYDHAGLDNSESIFNWVQEQMHCQSGGSNMNTCRNVANVDKFNAKWKLTINKSQANIIDNAEACKLVYAKLGYKRFEETPDPDPNANHIPPPAHPAHPGKKPRG